MQSDIFVQLLSAVLTVILPIDDSDEVSEDDVLFLIELRSLSVWDLVSLLISVSLLLCSLELLIVVLSVVCCSDVSVGIVFVILLSVLISLFTVLTVLSTAALEFICMLLQIVFSVELLFALSSCLSPYSHSGEQVHTDPALICKNVLRSANGILNNSCFLPKT